MTFKAAADGALQPVEAAPAPAAPPTRRATHPGVETSRMADAMSGTSRVRFRQGDGVVMIQESSPTSPGQFS